MITAALKSECDIDAPMVVKGSIFVCRNCLLDGWRWAGQDREGPLTVEGRLL